MITGPTRKPLWQQWWFLLFASVVFIAFFASLAGVGMEVEAAAPGAESEVGPEVEPRADPGTVSQQDARRSAERYLRHTPFSSSDLIGQLEFEGISTEDATWAVDSLSVDWNHQAASSAAYYLAFTAFSRSGLIDQLVWDGFTTAQASWGVDRGTIDWNEQAVRSAEYYRNVRGGSRTDLVDRLGFAGFTRGQAAYAVSRVGP